MKFKPKEVFVNLPVVHLFDAEDEIAKLASSFNTFLHGKVRLKYELLGLLNEQYVGLFYLQRNNESQQLRDEFMVLIEQSEMRTQHREEFLHKASGEQIIRCKQTPECDCDNCRDPYNGHTP